MRTETKLWAEYKKYIDKQNKEISKYNKKLLDGRDEVRKDRKDPYEQVEEFNKNKKWYQLKREVNTWGLIHYYDMISLSDRLLYSFLKSCIKPTIEGFMDWKLEQEKKKKK